MDVRVGKRAQVVIPAQLRRQLGIEEGDTLHIEIDQHDRLVMRKVVNDPFRRFQQAGKGLFDDTDPVAWQQGLREEWE